jgi:hypothetical protein
MVVDAAHLEYYFERQDNDSTWVQDPEATYEVTGVEGLTTTIGGSVSEDELSERSRTATLRPSSDSSAPRVTRLRCPWCARAAVRFGCPTTDPRAPGTRREACTVGGKHPWRAIRASPGSRSSR